MNSNDLYQASLKMLDDKYQIKEFSKDEFFEIYNKIYNNNQEPNNLLNKDVLFEIKKYIENKKPSNPDLELRIKEIENMRTSILNLKSINYDINNDNEIKQPQINQIQPIQITSYNNNHKYKTFIINSYKNSFRINPNIDINSHLIYPCCISIPIDIKNKTPYIILVISDGIKQMNYIYNPIIINNTTWDIWKPIIKDYIDLTMGNNNWIISLYDFTYNLIDFNEYIVIINDILEDITNFSLNVNKHYYFNINDKIKIIKNNGEIIDNKIIEIRENRLLINKLNLKLDDFINAKIINYKHNISLTFKYHIK